MSNLISRTSARSVAHDRRRPPAPDHRGTVPALLELVGRNPVLDLTDREPGPTAPAGRSGLVEHAVVVERPDDAAIPALVGRWLTEGEQATAAAKGDRARVGHVLGRVAAKQAIQAHLASLDFGPIDALRIEITNVATGAPVVRVRGARVAARHLAVSIAHGRGAAVAGATSAHAWGEPGIGVDIEAVEPRSSRFERLTLTTAEQALIPPADDDRDTWLTRLWSAKEAAAKATGRGLRGRPKDFVVDRVAGGRLRVDGRWIVTERTTFAGITHIVATTETHRTECSWHRS